jgi:hypothetical protein
MVYSKSTNLSLPTRIAGTRARWVFFQTKLTLPGLGAVQVSNPWADTGIASQERLAMTKYHQPSISSRWARKKL